MIITPISGSAIRRTFFGIDFEIHHRSTCGEAFNKRLTEVQAKFPDFAALPVKERAEINAVALAGTVVTNHDSFTDPNTSLQYEYGKELPQELKSPAYSTFTEKLLVEDANLRAWIYDIHEDLSAFEDKQRAEVIKKF